MQEVSEITSDKISHPLAINLADQWISDFFSANREIVWVAVEEERAMWLDSQTLLIGKVDARGITSDGEPFFGEWKTKSGRYAKRMDEVKQTWRQAPQALTYGVLLKNDATRFTVRWALKTDPPQTAFEWYTYTPAELNHWTRQLLYMGDGIRRWRAIAPEGPWPTNFGACDRHGVKYRCPHFNNGCGILDFTTPTGPPRQAHTEMEARIQAASTNPPAANVQFASGAIANVGDMVVLSSSRVADWLECPEQYRRNWEGAGFHEESEALTVGSDFHSMVGEYLQKLVKP